MKNPFSTKLIKFLNSDVETVSSVKQYKFFGFTYFTQNLATINVTIQKNNEKS